MYTLDVNSCSGVFMWVMFLQVDVVLCLLVCAGLDACMYGVPGRTGVCVSVLFFFPSAFVKHFMKHFPTLMLKLHHKVSLEDDISWTCFDSSVYLMQRQFLSLY